MTRTSRATRSTGTTAAVFLAYLALVVGAPAKRLAVALPLPLLIGGGNLDALTALAAPFAA